MSLRLSWWWLLVAVALGSGLLAACSVRFDDTRVYFCRTNADCGGDNYVCAINPNSGGRCCLPTGTEQCDGVDNDCDGLVDNTGKAETCNGLDDDCNGTADDGFDLRTNPSHCGACNHACASNQFCKAGECITRLENICYDGLDDDGNGLTDCADDACDGRSCGAACVCEDHMRAEDLCSDGVDNEGDSLTDCADPDCTGKACARGCACVAGGAKKEVDCTDGVDNDGDSVADCLDDDCLDQFCTPPDIYFQCAADHVCRCNGGVQVAEVGSVRCRDGIDNDCNGHLDCDEATCEGQSCAPDGGAGCTCAAGGAGKKETDCTNGLDDDGDQKVDCADEDCPAGTACTPEPDAGVVCAAQHCG